MASVSRCIYVVIGTQDVKIGLLSSSSTSKGRRRQRDSSTSTCLPFTHLFCLRPDSIFHHHRNEFVGHRANVGDVLKVFDFCMLRTTVSLPSPFGDIVEALTRSMAKRAHPWVLGPHAMVSRGGGDGCLGCLSSSGSVTVFGDRGSFVWHRCWCVDRAASTAMGA